MKFRALLAVLVIFFSFSCGPFRRWRDEVDPSKEWVCTIIDNNAGWVVNIFVLNPGGNISTPIARNVSAGSETPPTMVSRLLFGIGHGFYVQVKIGDREVKRIWVNNLPEDDDICFVVEVVEPLRNSGYTFRKQ